MPPHALLGQMIRLLLRSEFSTTLERTLDVALRAAVRHVPRESLHVHQQPAALGALQLPLSTLRRRMDLHLVEGQLLVAVCIRALDQADRTLVSFMFI